MVEGGGISKAGKTEFTECWRTTWKTPYIMRLALSAGIGGLLFGYDTGKKKNPLPSFICFRHSQDFSFTLYSLKIAFLLALCIDNSDIGVISGALLYIREDFKAVDKKTWLQVQFL